MQINLDCNCPKPQFGMAFRKPQGKDLGKLSDYVGMEKEINRKGFAQYVNQLKNNKRFDVDYVADGNTARVIDSNTEEVIDSFHGSKDITGLEHFGTVSYPGKSLLARIFDPKQFLPYNLLLAGEKAKQLEAKEAERQAVRKVMDNLL